MTKSVLVIEDDRDIRDAMIELLEGEGYDVRAASNGQEGIDQLRGGQIPDLILLDLMMPIKDGFEFRQEQISDPRFAQIPVVIMTADGHVEEKRRRIGVEDFLRKPLDIDSAVDVLRKHLS